ncbi:ubiquinone biosynthesis regulatory protein kinase UbiB [Saccharospirillum mangrovi]|uniref:ubiquinone biosynthesis regulatory protein kinase UbiB n=1 Tax=Saccharospirillum mangrovi TaxID=2161747 RepID=UPI000D3C72BB|nr:ubiquinone biosynthesis regulatory protein kinase UbiB [Saccharospirillum mangrovi]
MTFLRLIRIAWVLSRYRLDTLLRYQQVPWPIRVAQWFFPLRWMIPARGNEGYRLRRALETLGPVFVKFGQILSTRRDLLPAEMATELAYLQDRVPSFSSKKARALIEEALGGNIETLFAEFDDHPLASASIAQVHSARLPNGEAVVVKVIRPGIRSGIVKDVRLMEVMAWLVNMLPDGHRLRPLDVVEDFRKTILDELDLLREASNLATFKRNFADSELLYIPWVHWEYTRRNVLVMERINGIGVSSVDELNAIGVDMKILAERGVEIFFTQVFRDSFFHADMHPGNIFVSRDNPQSPQYIGIDCGIVGSLSREDQSYLAQNLLAFFNRDYYRVAELHVESGWVPANTRVNEFEAAIRAVCEPIFEKPLAEISFGLLLVRLFQTAQRFDMHVQPQLVLLQKTLLNVEGLGRQLYPQLDLWATAKPFLEKWMRDQVGPKRLLKAIQQHGPGWLAKAPQMPDLVHDTLLNLRQIGQIEQRVQQRLADLQISQQRANRKLTRRLLATVLLLFVIWTGDPGAWLLSLSPRQWAGLGVGAFLLLWP